MNLTISWSRSLKAMALLALTGCASTNSNTARQAVQTDVSAQTGMSVVWNQNTADDQKAEAAVRQILARPLDVNGAVQVALLGNPDLQASFEQIGISQADLVQAGLLHNPTLMASWRFPDRPPSITDTEYSLAADFLDLVMIPLRVKVARANLLQTQLHVDTEVLRLATEVKSAFYAYQAGLQIESRFKLIVQANQASADLAKAQQQAGNANEMDSESRQAELASSQLYLIREQRDLVAEREKLNRLLGLSGADLSWKIDPNLPDPPDREVPLDHLESLALANRRDLAAMKQEVDAIGLALSLKTHTRFLPAAINIGVDTEQTPDAQRVTGPTLDLELPVFDQGQGGIAQLTAQDRMARRQLQALTLQIGSEIREARANLKMDRALVEYYRKVVVPLNIHVVNQSLLQYNAMQKNAFDLFLNKERELETERDYIEARRDYWIALAELEEAVGGRLRPSIVSSH